jgi:hypothetical protein
MMKHIVTSSATKVLPKSPLNTPYDDPPSSCALHLILTNTKGNPCYYTFQSHFFFPLDLPFGGGAGLEAVDITLEAREDGAAEVALLPAPDLMLSRALF